MSAPFVAAMRVYAALQQMAGSDGIAAASYDQIRAAVGCNRTTVGRGLQALIQGGWITPLHGYKAQGAYQYIIHPVPGPQEVTATQERGFGASIRPHSYPFVPIRTHSYPNNGTNGYECAPVISAAAFQSAAAGTHHAEKSAPETEPEPLMRMKALLSEFAIGEPVRSQLAAILVEKAAQEQQIRRICEFTKAEWQAGKVKNPAGLTIVRLRDHANGVQLSMLQEVPNKPVEAPRRRAAGDRMKRGGRTFMRPQVEYSTEAEREEARQRAQERIAARAAPAQDDRWAAKAAQMRAALNDPRTTAEQRKYYETCLAQMEGRQGGLS